MIKAACVCVLGLCCDLSKRLITKGRTLKKLMLTKTISKGLKLRRMVSKSMLSKRMLLKRTLWNRLVLIYEEDDVDC